MAMMVSNGALSSMRILMTDGWSSGFTGLCTDLYIETISLTIVNKLEISFLILVLLLDLLWFI